MALILEDHDQWDTEPPVADPTQWLIDVDWATGFEFAGGVR